MWSLASAWSHRELWSINCASASSPTLRQGVKTVMHIISRWGDSCSALHSSREGGCEPSAANLDNHWRKGIGPSKGICVRLQECPPQWRIVFCKREKIQKQVIERNFVYIAQAQKHLLRIVQICYHFDAGIAGVWGLKGPWPTVGPWLHTGKNSRSSQHSVYSVSEFISETETDNGLLHGQFSFPLAEFDSFIEVHLIQG